MDKVKLCCPMHPDRCVTRPGDSKKRPPICWKPLKGTERYTCGKCGELKKGQFSGRVLHCLKCGGLVELRVDFCTKTFVEVS